MLGIWSRKFQDPNDPGKNGTKFTGAFERNGPRIKRFGKPEQHDVDETLLKWFQREISDTSVPLSGSVLIMTFGIPTFLFF